MKNLMVYLSYVQKRYFAPALLIAALAAFPIAVLASDAPGSIPYAGENTQGPDHAAFNVYSGDIPGVPSDAGEQDFVTVKREAVSSDPWSNDFEACDGEVTVAIYLHNGAEVQFNDSDLEFPVENLNGPGVARGSRMAVNVPSGSGDNRTVSATLSADNVPAITDNATITCGQHEIELDYVDGSAEIFRQLTGQFDPFSDAVVSQNGTLVSSAIPGSVPGIDAGDIPGCWEYRVIVLVKVKVKKVEQPEPIFKCDVLEAIKIDRDTFRLKAEATAQNGATVTSYDFEFGDGATETATTSALSATTSEHTYAPGTYNAQVTVNFDTDGDGQADASDVCKTTVKVAEKPEQPPEKPPVEELPVTGIGGVLSGVFGTGALSLSVRSWLESRSMLRAGVLRKED